MNFTQRLEKIKTVEDAEAQLRLAKQYAKRLRNEAKKAELLSEKLALNERLKHAEYTLRQLRRAIFDIEDALAGGLPVSSITG
ncbi:hypothetical protein [Alteromonas oceanisediminis]|uniref:hypothetical protein n=1 Tax=Alteromonas oceanisediminis TaxID=2836180 RepID=UPI001BDA4C18|nr:hypothetical protein [Alteromonas oceanisediminis]MBT0587969.1 hypothetical protein [Alteromonas oceanisediminis]